MNLAFPSWLQLTLLPVQSSKLAVKINVNILLCCQSPMQEADVKGC